MKRLLLCSLLGLTATSSVFATGPYVALGGFYIARENFIDQAVYDAIDDYVLDGTDYSWRLAAGYRWDESDSLNFVTLELGYNDNGTSKVGTDFSNYESNAVYTSDVQVKFNYRPWEHIGLFAGGGIVYEHWNYELYLSDTKTASSSDAYFTPEQTLGLSYFFNDHLSLDADAVVTWGHNSENIGSGMFYGVQLNYFM